jgi:threonine aldolase
MGKFTPVALEGALGGYGPSQLHQMQAAVLSIAQATDRGTVHSLDELRSLMAAARKAGLKIHMDGARFANALVSLGCSPAEVSWKAGVDALSFGTIKNGAMTAEAVIVFDKALAESVRFRHKRAGFLHSKMRYFAAQLLAYIEDGLWLDNARCANSAARRISKRLAAAPGVELAFPTEVNQIFAHLPPALTESFEAAGLRFRPWAASKPHLYRLVMSYADDDHLLSQVETVLERWARD